MVKIRSPKVEVRKNAECRKVDWLWLKLTLFRHSGANCKTSAVCNFQGPFPLTPALSLREREKQGPHCNNFKRLTFSNALATMLALLEGEGRGEGEQIVRIPDGSDFCNRLSDFGFLSDFGIRVSDFNQHLPPSPE